MYYELEIYDITVTEAALEAEMKKALDDGVSKQLAIVQNAKHALKSIFGGGNPTYSIAMGKEIITSIQVVNADPAASNPLTPPPKILPFPGLRIAVTGHLYEPYKEYDNAALLFLWFQEMANYNIPTTKEWEHQTQIEADMKKIDPNEMSAKTRSLQGLALKTNLSAWTSILNEPSDEATKKTQAAGIGLRRVVLRVLNDNGFVFRIYYLPQAYLANYAESYDMEKDTGEFSMLLVQDEASGKAQIKGSDMDTGLTSLMNKVSRGAAKAKTYVDGAAAAAQTAAAVANSVASISLMLAKGDEDSKTYQFMKKFAAGADATANGVGHVGDGMGAIGSMGKGGATQESMDQLTKATESLAQDERDMATKAAHPEILEEEERKKMKEEAEAAAELKIRVAALEQAKQKKDEEKNDEAIKKKPQDEQKDYEAAKTLKARKIAAEETEKITQETKRVEQEADYQMAKEKIKEETDSSAVSIK